MTTCFRVRSCAVFFIAASLLLSFVTVIPGAPTLPTIPAYTTNVTQSPYNANGNGISTNTTAIQNAINDVSAKGGGTVEIPGPGIYLTGPLTMKSKINLQIDAGATLRMLPYATWYPTYSTTPLLTLPSLQNIEISGGGTIDGQGAAWYASNPGSGLYMIYFTSCNTVLVQNVTISNAPAQQIVFKSSKGGNITIQGITISTPSSHANPPAKNTDGIDLVGTNCLIQNCSISTGDDNIALGTSSSGVPTSDVLVTNCTFGDGHGMSIGSNTEGGVSNLTVINCTFNGTDYGIRMKSDNAISGGSGQGGIAQNLFYYNLGMTSIRYQPILIYSYYNEDSSPTGIAPATAAGESIGSSLYPIWQNIVISNLTATVASGGEAGMIWGRTESPATNIILKKINITAPANFKLYNVKGLQILDSQITLTGGGNTFSIYDAQFTITNSSPSSSLITFDGLTTNGYGNVLSLYNTQASLKNTNVLDDGPLTLSASTLTISNNLTLFPSTVLNYSLGASATTVSVISNLALGGTINVTNGAGFTNGAYTLLTCVKAISGNLPTLGSVLANYNYSLNTNTAGQVNLVVTLLAPTNLVAMGTNLLINLKWNSVSGAASYNLKRGTVSGVYPTIFSALISTNFADANVTNAVNYFYVVSAVGAGGESSNSLPASATPLPSNQPTNLVLQAGDGQLQLSWPQDHLGWSLQIQTNSPNRGLGTNWATVLNSQTTNQIIVPIIPTNGSVFLRLTYP